MRIKVRTLDHSTIELEVDPSIKIADLKQLIARSSNMPAARQRLIFKGRVLANEQPLSTYNVQQDEVLHLVSMPEPAGGSAAPQTSTSNLSASVPPTSQMPNVTNLSASTPLPANGNSVLLGSISLPEGTPMPDLNSIVNSVLSTMGGIPAQQPQPAAGDVNTQQRRNINIRRANIGLVEPQTTGVRLTNMATVGDMLQRLQTLFVNNRNEMSQLSNLLSREGQLSAEERQRAQQLAHNLTPIINDLTHATAELQPMISNLHMGAEAGQAHTISSRPQVQNVSVHVHANANEIDQLPEQLNRLHSLVDVQQSPFHIGQQRTVRQFAQGAQPLGASITIVQENGVPPQGMLPQFAPPRPQQQPQPAQQQPQQQQQQQPAPQRPPNPLQSLLQSFTSPQGGAGGAQPQLNLGQLMQSVAPLVQNILQPQQQQPQQNPAGTTTQQQPGFGQMLGNIIQSAGGAQASVGTVISSMETMLRTETTQQPNKLDELIKVATEALDITDMLAFASGNWSCLEKTAPNLKKHLQEKLLNNDISEQNRTKLLEETLAEMEKDIRSNTELMSELNQRTNKDVNAIILEIIEISRTYLKLAIDVIIDGPEKHHAMLQLQGSTGLFAAALKKIVDFYVCETMDVLVTSCKNGTPDAEKIIQVVLQKSFSRFPENIQSMASLGTGMVLQLVMKTYASYKQTYPTRATTRTRAPSSAPAPVPVTSSPAAASSSSSVAPSTAPKSQESPAPAPAPTPVAQQTSQQPATAASTTTSSTGVSWFAALSESERNFLKETIAKDVEEMKTASSSSETLSEAYLSGSSNKAEKKKATGGSSKPAEQHEDEEDEIDID